MTQPMGRQHRQMARIAYAIDSTAYTVADAVEHLGRELSLCDGYVARGETYVAAGRISSVETVAMHRQTLTRHLADIQGAINTLDETHRRLAHLAQSALYDQPSAASQVARCRDNQKGRTGAIEWGDPLCEELPAKSSLCAPCYQRERRWRILHGYPLREEVA